MQKTNSTIRIALLLFVVFISTSIDSYGSFIRAVANSALLHAYPFSANTDAQLQYENAIYWPSVKTVTSHVSGIELSQPIIALNSQETIDFGFDELSGSVQDFYYTIIHCDPNWKPSDMMEQEYMSGFFSYNVTNYDFSFNTFQNYVHYSVQIPNERTKILRSGNYILLIYANNDQSKIVLSRRFMVYENQIGIQAQYKRASDPNVMFYKQEIDFTLLTSGVNVINPFSDLEVIILQNGRWDNALRNLKPRFVKGSELVYDLDEPQIFNGSNEFRFLDLKSIAYRTPNVASIDRTTTPYHIHLLNEEKRPYRKYITNYDINGNFIIRNEDASQHPIESDYFYVHFYLPYDNPVAQGGFYLFGGLTDFQLKKNFKFNYNEQTKKYELTAFLKQGYYNYFIVYAENEESNVDETMVEGNHYETENQYTILVYLRDIRLNFYRLVGLKQINSVKG